jgi:uncharacterized protein
MIIDAHVHISIYKNNANSLEESLVKLLEQMKQNGITHAIVIPDNVETVPSIAGLQKARELIKNHPNLFLLGSPNILHADGHNVDFFRELFSAGIIKGLKLFPGHEPLYPNDTRCDPYYELLEKLDYPIVFHTGDISADPTITNPAQYNDPKYIVEVAKKYPQLKVIITHYFWPEIEYCYQTTKNIPNIYFELAGCGDGEVLEACGGIEKMREVLKKTIHDRPDKVIFGTDWPMCDSKEKSGFLLHKELVRSLDLSQEVEEMIFFKNAIRIYTLRSLNCEFF